MSKSRRNTKSNTKTNTRDVRDSRRNVRPGQMTNEPVRRPEKKEFGTNPAQSESHVSLPPEMLGPDGPGYLDDVQDTMLA